MKKNIKQKIAFFIFSFLTFNSYIYSQENIESLKINDFEKLRKLEEEIIIKLTNKERASLPGKRITVSFSFYSGFGGILATGKIKDSFKFGYNIYCGGYVNLDLISDLYLSVESHIIKMTAISRNTVYQGVDIYIISHEDGKFTMIPVLFGLEYRFRLFKNFYLSPGFAIGISFNKIILPSRVNEDSSIGYEASSTDLALKGNLKIHYFIIKGFNVKAFFDILFIKEPSLNGLFLSFGAILSYQF